MIIVDWIKRKVKQNCRTEGFVARSDVVLFWKDGRPGCENAESSGGGGNLAKLGNFLEGFGDPCVGG